MAGGGCEKIIKEAFGTGLWQSLELLFSTSLWGKMKVLFSNASFLVSVEGWFLWMPVKNTELVSVVIQQGLGNTLPHCPELRCLVARQGLGEGYKY